MNTANAIKDIREHAKKAGLTMVRSEDAPTGYPLYDFKVRGTNKVVLKGWGLYNCYNNRINFLPTWNGSTFDGNTLVSSAVPNELNNIVWNRI